MKISVAVPSYNYARFLPTCLDSIRQQQHEDFEVLIADGGSTDSSIEIIESYCKVDPRFRLVSRQDKGQADGIRQAFAEANGEILCFLNADDCYLNDQVFSTVLETFKREPTAGVATYGGYYLDIDGRMIKQINYRYHPLDGIHLMRYRTAVIQPATFWLKHVYDEASWPSNFHFVFDVVFFYNAYLHYPWVMSHQPMAGYRLHGDNKSMSVRPSRISELARFEAIKFGEKSFRVTYLNLIASLVGVLDRYGSIGKWMNRLIYLLVNGISYITCYRMPGI